MHGETVKFEQQRSLKH